MFWGAISKSKSGSSIVVSNRKKSVDYLTLLDNELLPYFQFLKVDKQIMDTQFQDNCMSVEKLYLIGLRNKKIMIYASDSVDVSAIEKIRVGTVRKKNMNIKKKIGYTEGSIYH